MALRRRRRGMRTTHIERPVCIIHASANDNPVVDKHAANWRLVGPQSKFTLIDPTQPVASLIQLVVQVHLTILIASRIKASW